MLGSKDGLSWAKESCELLWRGSGAKCKLRPKAQVFRCGEDTAGSLPATVPGCKVLLEAEGL